MYVGGSGTNPLVAWITVFVTVGLSFVMWLAGEPLRQSLLDAVGGQLAIEAATPLNIVTAIWFGVPIIISVLITIWAFLVTTKRQAVINQGGYFE